MCDDACLWRWLLVSGYTASLGCLWLPGGSSVAFRLLRSLNSRKSHKAQQSGPWLGQEGKMTKRALPAEAPRHRKAKESKGQTAGEPVGTPVMPRMCAHVDLCCCHLRAELQC
jgi:hypothetical protein